MTYTQAVDAFGRKRTETAPDGNETRSYQKVCDASCPAGAVAISITDHVMGGQRSALPSLVCSDSAGHVLRTQSWGFDGRVVVADAAYNARGRVFETYCPARMIKPALVFYLVSYNHPHEKNPPALDHRLPRQHRIHHQGVRRATVAHLG